MPSEPSGKDAVVVDNAAAAVALQLFHRCIVVPQLLVLLLTKRLLLPLVRKRIVVGRT